MTYVKIQDHNCLVRDMDSMAVLNTNKSELQIYTEKRRKAKQIDADINILKEELQDIKTDMSTIKKLLERLCNNGN